MKPQIPSCLAAILLLAPYSAAAEQPDTVIMQLGEFMQLYEKSRKPDEVPETAPRDYAVSEARYQGEVLLEDGEPSSALFVARLHVEVLKAKGWVQIPLVPGTVAVREVTIGGRPAATSGDGSWLYLVTERKGAFDVDVTFATSVFTAEGRSGLSFQPTPAGAVAVELRVPAEDALDFVVAGAKLQSDRTVGTQRVVEAVLPGTASVAVSWQREIPEATEPEKARVYAEVFSLVGLGEGLLQSSTTLAYTILQAGVHDLSVQIPPGTTLVDVEGTGIRDWTLGQDGTLLVSLNYAAEGSYRLVLSLEQAIGDGNTEVAAPLPAPTGVDRSKGWIGVEARGALEIEGGQTTGVTTIDVRTLPAAILGLTSNPILLAYKYLGTGASLPLKVTRHEDVAVLVTLLDRAEATTMVTADGRRLTQVRYRVRNNRRQFLRLSLPQGSELWSASVAGRAVQPARAADGRILVPLIRSESSGGELADFEVGVVYVETGTAPGKDGRGSLRAAMPTADVPITYVGWTVYTPWEAKVRRKSIDGSLRSVDALSQPFDRGDLASIQANAPYATYQVNQGAEAQVASGGLDGGAAPVAVNVPLEGRPAYFEKLLALGEELWVGFDYSGLKR